MLNDVLTLLDDIIVSCGGSKGECPVSPCCASDARLLRRKVKRRQQQIERALKVHDEALWNAAEWNRDDSDEPYSRVHARSDRAAMQLRQLIGLPAKNGAQGPA